MGEGSEPGGPVVVAVFTGLSEAEMARSVLEAEGLEAVLQGSQLVGMAWHLSNAVGGVRLAVPAEQAERARLLLGASTAGSVEPEPEPPEVAPASGEAPRKEEAAAQGEAPANEEAPAPEPGPGDALARRAWLSSLIGFLLAPPLLHLWSIWLLMQARRAGGPRTAEGKRFAFQAGAVDFVVLCAVGALIALASGDDTRPRASPRAKAAAPYAGPLVDVPVRPRHQPPRFPEPSEEEHAGWEQQCNAGSAHACFKFGGWLVGEGRKDEARVPLGRACSGDDAWGCVLLGISSWDDRPDEALNAFQKGCELKNAVACTQEWFELSTRGEKSDPQGAGKLFEIGCDLGDAGGCNRYGAWLEENKKDAREAASRRYRQACDSPGGQAVRELPGLDEGKAYGCFNLGRLENPFKQFKRLELFQKGCELGAARACFAVAATVQALASVRDAAQVASAYYQQACDLGSDDGCTALALLWLSGKQSPGPGDAPALLRRACVHGFAPACRELGLVLLGSERAKAIAPLKAACDWKDGRACWELARLGSAHTTGLPEDPAFAREMTERACSFGYREACPSGAAK
jgi:TPR repeat protein